MTALLLAALLAAGQASPTPSPEGAADPDLEEEVASVARRVEVLRGLRFKQVPASIRLAEEAHRAPQLGERPAEDVDFAARGRAWADVGFGDARGPAELDARLRRDLEGVSVDPAGRTLRAEPWVLPEEDLTPEPGKEAAGATLLLTTGVRPDGPLLAHALTHGLERQAGEGAPADTTTDALLAARAWSEGEANLVAVRYLFEAMGLEDEILAHRVDLGEIAGGRLLPAPSASAPAPIPALLSFVYEDGFAQAVAWHKRGGFRALATAKGSRRTTRDVMHPERSVPPAPTGPKDVVPPGYRVADRDRLGEQGIVVLVSSGTGKDNLGLLAGDGWVEDALVRLEPAKAGEGATVWQSRWTEPAEAAEFADAYRRVVDGREGTAMTPVEGSPGRWVLRAGGRVVRVDQREREVHVRVAPSGLDAALEKPPAPRTDPSPPRR
ncbi:MAG TPA: hypothetical protein VFV75_04775 [Candidatus Polarisedimenticolaceae bacterium]|nr:hypothetical protein [Candidatus Polarisedimenticolaceae bacterium]